jgi:Multiubiquitin
MSNEAHKPAHEYTIIVNAREKKVTSATVTYEQVVALAFDPVPSGENILITVTYRGAEGKQSGTLTPGQSVEVKNGTIFDVKATDKS